MTKSTLLFLGLGVFALSACQGNTPNQNAAIGGLTGAAVGLGAADLADASDEAKIGATLIGAAAGTAIGANQGARRCTYANGAPAPCPPRY
ncbi:glucose-6-phosphate isomerase [Frigidibacter oleivorans]|uniref:glucose-6-phosphate isomerase n=1 Tax=Frigidibacter oleivorans TaxID=2487129 RepID=UPI000F8CB6E5|nr:glucose-6-phosphate isomerase [Frigidibacter oleivorans]